MSGREWSVEKARVVVEAAADGVLREPVTVEEMRWADGEFRITAFHTIEETLGPGSGPSETDTGVPYYREVVTYNSHTGDLTHEVRRQRTGETGIEVVYKRDFGVGFGPGGGVSES